MGLVWSSPTLTATADANMGTEANPILFSAICAKIQAAGSNLADVFDASYTAANITAITQANPGVITCGTHGLTTGQRVFISGIVGMTQLNDRVFHITVISTTQISLVVEHGTDPEATNKTPLDTTAYTAWSSGGTVRRINPCQVFAATAAIAANTWVKFDSDSSLVLLNAALITPTQETALNANNGSATILGYRFSCVITTNVARFDDACVFCKTGGRHFSQADLAGNIPSINSVTSFRNDWPTLTSTTFPAEFRIEGISKKAVSTSFKAFGGNSRNVGGRDLMQNITGQNSQLYNSTYRNMRWNTLFVFDHDTTPSNAETISSVFGVALTASAPMTGSIRGGRIIHTDPNWSGWWNGAMSLGGPPASGCIGAARYTSKTIYKIGTTPVVMRSRRTRAVEGTVVGYDLSLLAFGAEAAVRFQTSDGNGVDQATCYDFLIGHTIGGLTGLQALERYSWSHRARSYTHRTFAEDVFTGRRYGQEGTNGPVTEEVQTEAVPYQVLSEAAAGALTGIAMSASGAASGTLTTSEAHTLSEVWDYINHWMTRDANYSSNRLIIEYDGATLNLGSWNLVVSASDLSGGSVVSAASVTASLTMGGAYVYTGGNLTTPTAAPILEGGTIEIGAAGAYGFLVGVGTSIVGMTPTAPGTYTLLSAHTGTLDLRNRSVTHAITVIAPYGVTAITTNNTGAAITVVNPAIALTINAASLPDGSTVGVYNMETDPPTEIDYVASTSGGYSGSFDAGTDFANGDVIEFRAIGVDGATATKEYTQQTVGDASTNTIFTITTALEACPIYNELAIDGSAITGYDADYVDTEVDITVASNFYIAELYAWWKYNLTTQDGMRLFWGGMTPVDIGNFQINNSVVNAHLDNTTSTDVWALDNRRLFRADGARPIKFPTTGGGGIDVEWREKVLFVNDADIVAIKAKTDNLPSDPADQSLIEAAIAAIPAPDNASVAAIKAKTDALTFTVAGQVDANIQYVNDVQVKGVGSEADPWNPT